MYSAVDGSASSSVAGRRQGSCPAVGGPDGIPLGEPKDVTVDMHGLVVGGSERVGKALSDVEA